MSDVATPTAAPTAATESNGKPAPGTRELAEFYAKKAVVARNADVAAAQEGMEAARAEGDAPAEETPAEPAEGRERGKDGKFKPKGAKDAKQAKPKPADATVGEGAGQDAGAAAVVAPDGDAARESGDAPTGGLSQARKLVSKGDIAAALKLIGLHPEKLEGKQWGAFRQREKAAQDAIRHAEQMQQELRQIHAGLERKYGAIDEARKLYEAEDYDAAFKIWTGESPDDFQRKRIHAMHTKAKDPEVVKLRKELEALRVEKQTEEPKYLYSEALSQRLLGLRIHHTLNQTGRIQ